MLLHEKINPMGLWRQLASCRPAARDETDDLLESHNDIAISHAQRIIVAIAVFIFILSVWACSFSIDEVSKGDGKVIPISKEQSIQSMDGGIIQKIFVKEGDVVLPGDALVQLDSTRTSSSVQESQAKYYANIAQLARLQAEVNDQPLVFPDELKAFPALMRSEMNLYQSRKAQFRDSLNNLSQSKNLVSHELSINDALAKQGAASAVDVIRLRRQLVDLSMKEDELKTGYYVKSREDMARISAETASLKSIIRGRSDVLNKSRIVSPVKGIIKDIEINTRGGVVPPNGVIMHIVPTDDTLLIEAKISPKDIAFIHPGQNAIVKITAYDYSIFGGLTGVVATISPDTIKDEQKPDAVHYRVYIKTDKDYLELKNHHRLFITPGMIATVDIKTGHKTVAQYLLKPFNKVNEALRER